MKTILIISVLFMFSSAQAGILKKLELHGGQAEVCNEIGEIATIRMWDSLSLIIVSGNRKMAEVVVNITDGIVVVDQPLTAVLEVNNKVNFFTATITKRNSKNYRFEVHSDELNNLVFDSEYCK